MDRDKHRAVVFAHYDAQDVVDPYVYYYLNKLADVSSKIVFVTTSNISPEEVQDLEQLGCDVVVRDNFGYDFMSYRVGLESFNFAFPRCKLALYVFDKQFLAFHGKYPFLGKGAADHRSPYCRGCFVHRFRP